MTPLHPTFVKLFGKKNSPYNDPDAPNAIFRMFFNVMYEKMVCNLILMVHNFLHIARISFEKTTSIDSSHRDLPIGTARVQKNTEMGCTKWGKFSRYNFQETITFLTLIRWSSFHNHLKAKSPVFSIDLKRASEEKKVTEYFLAGLKWCQICPKSWNIFCIHVRGFVQINRIWGFTFKHCSCH